MTMTFERLFAMRTIGNVIAPLAIFYFGQCGFNIRIIAVQRTGDQAAGLGNRQGWRFF